MSDSLAITVQSLLSQADVTAVFGQRIQPIFVPQQIAYPNAVVHLIHEVDEMYLCGLSGVSESRVSVEMRTQGDVPMLSQGARAVIKALSGRDYEVAGHSVTFLKDGTDVTDHSQSTSPESRATVIRRIIDFNLRWQAICQP